MVSPLLITLLSVPFLGERVGHQSHIINLDYIKKFVREDGGYVLMDDGAEILVARRRKEDFINVLTGKGGS